MDVKPSLWKSISSPARFIILVQSIVIAFLSFWIYQEYLNNRYLQAYVNDYFQTEGWVIVVLAVVVGLGTVTIPLFQRNRTVKKRVEAVSIEAEVPQPVAAPPREVSSKPDVEFHPVVAALKAELAGRPMAIGTASVPSTGEPKTVPGHNAVESNTVAIDQPSTSPHPIVASPTPELASAPTPVGSVPFPRMESRESAGTQPPLVAGPTIPRDVTTVITGVIPVPKKREPEAPAEEKPSSQ